MVPGWLSTEEGYRKCSSISGSETLWSSGLLEQPPAPRPLPPGPYLPAGPNVLALGFSRREPDTVHRVFSLLPDIKGEGPPTLLLRGWENHSTVLCTSNFPLILLLFQQFAPLYSQCSNNGF